MKSIIVPSTVGVGSTDLGGLTLGDFSKGHRTETPHRVEWGQTARYLVGENVAQFTRRWRVSTSNVSRMVWGCEH